MARQDFELPADTRASAGKAWFEYLGRIGSFRSELFRYCRRLTGDVWDAEDLVQDTLEQGFARLATVRYEIRSPRAYLLRIASNLWIDRIRRGRVEAAALARQADDPDVQRSTPARAADGLDVRDAGARLLGSLSPQERAAWLLKEVFDYSLEEIAEVLGTTVGAIKSALHRGRGRLEEEAMATSNPSAPRSEVVEEFVSRYNARDLPGLLALMLDDGSIEMTGYVYETGRDVFGRPRGWFHHNFFDPLDDQPTDAVWEVVDFRGESIVLVLYGPEGEQVVGSVMRIEATEDRISRIRVYALCQDVIEEVARALGRTSRAAPSFLPGVSSP